MNYSIDDSAAQALAQADADGSTEALDRLSEMGTRTFRAHNLRKQMAFLEGEAAGPQGCEAAQQAIAAWQQSNMSAAAAETLLSRVLEGYRGGLGPTATPGLIAEVIEMRGRASELLYVALVLTR